MKRKVAYVILFILIAMVISIIGFVIFYPRENLENNKTATTEEAIQFLESSMYMYGNYLINGTDYLDQFSVSGEYRVYLEEMLNSDKFDQQPLDLLECNYNNTYLNIIINKDEDDASLEVITDCLVNQDQYGAFYNHQKLEDKLLEYGKDIASSYDTTDIDDSATIEINLEQLRDVYNRDISMFMENYDLKETKVLISFNEDTSGYSNDYKCVLTKKND